MQIEDYKLGKETEYRCPLCDEVFSSPEQLKRHRRTAYRAMLDEIKAKPIKKIE